MHVTGTGHTRRVLYERPVAELMVDVTRELHPPLRPQDVVAWFADRYPLVRATTVRAHVIGLTDNHPSRHHYAGLAQRQPLFHRDPDGTMVLFEPDEHLTDDLAASTPSSLYPDLDPGTPTSTDPSMDESPAAEPHEFYLEAHLERFLIDNWARIDWGRPLRMWVGPDGRSGHQFATPVGRLDFLCEDTATGALVVVELKRGMPSDQVVGQTARYMGWVSVHLADGRPVDGIVVAHDADDRLRYAIPSVPGVSLLLYEVTFKLASASAPQPQ